MQDIHDLQIDIDLKENLLVNATCKQLDNLNLIFNIYYNGLVVDLSNYEVELRALKSDQVPLIQNTNITINNNVITIKGDYQLTTTSGIVECEILLINKTTKEKKFSFNLNLKVIKSVFEVDRSISKATYNLLEQLENKIDEVRDIGLNLNEAKTVNTELKGNISTGTTLNTDLKTDIINANASKSALETSKTNADTSKSALDTATNNANTKKQEVEITIVNAETKKQEVITECGVADAKIQKMQSFGDVSNVVQDVTKLKENVAINTASLSEKANQSSLNTTNTNVSNHLADLITDINGAHGVTYETGTWTPQLYDISSNPLSQSSQTGKYEKINKKVIVSFRLTVNGLNSSSGRVILKGFPFASDVQFMYGCNIDYFNADVNLEYINGILANGELTLRIKKEGVALENLLTTNIPTGLDIVGTLIYYTV